ncbi:MAG: class II aldolase/adducin family protein [Bacteroidota bacterium]|nr:class II aldolase/adducin family protein [Bacteroidota bacterium]
MTLINHLLYLTQPFVNRPDLIQGPGGNTSVKDEEGNMIIKASGFRFEEITVESGYSKVNSKKISDYFFNVKVTDKTQEEKHSLQVIQNNILKQSSGEFFPKPSMETGFHAVLDEFVIHTHSVWSNLINCITEPFELLKKIQSKTGLIIAYIPFVSPGFGLSYLITQELKKANELQIKRPQIFFLENHGIVSHSNDLVEAQTMLLEVDKAIQNLLGISNEYPKTEILSMEKYYTPSNDFVWNSILKYQVDKQFFNQVLFPDQTVFFNNQITFSEDFGKKINIIPVKGIQYHCGEREAKSIHETMTAYFFLFDNILKLNKTPRFVSNEEIDYINNMDMEKHRKSLMK